MSDLACKIENKPSGPDIDETCRKPLDSISGGLKAVGQRLLTRLGGVEPGIHEGWVVWHVKLQIDVFGLDIGGAARKPYADSGGTLIEARKRPLEGLGA